MKKLPTISMADLLQFRTEPEMLDVVAAFFGFEKISLSVSPPPVIQTQSDSPTSTLDAEVQLGLPEITFPTERPRLKFLRAVRAEKLQAIAPRDRGNPLSDAELAVDWTKKAPSLPPLIRWSRLGPFLRNRLGCVITGSALDERKLLRQVGTGLPLKSLPRLKRHAWAAAAVLLWDMTPEMFPFTRDVQGVLQRIRRERGTNGLKVVELKSLPRSRDFSRIPAGTPIVAISAMGCFCRSPETMARWRSLAASLEFRGLALQGLNPSPRNRWSLRLSDQENLDLSKICPSVVWDRRPRLPRHGGQRAIPSASMIDPSTVDLLLNLLAPSSLIESPLLRTTRLKLGAVADSGTEWDAWHHSDCWNSLNCFGIRAGEPMDSRLEQRRQLIGRSAELARKVGELMAVHHETCSVVIRNEAELRACLSGSPNEETMNRLQGLLQRAVDRLRLLAAKPGCLEGTQSGLPRWFISMVNRLSSAMRADRTIDQSIAQGLALAHIWQQTAHLEVSEGINISAFDEETRAAAGRRPHPNAFNVGLRGNTLVLSSRAESEYARSKTRESFDQGLRTSDVRISSPIPLGILRVGNNRLKITVTSGATSHHSIACDETDAPSVTFDVSPSSVVIETSHDRQSFEVAERPAWASRMWCDKFGLATEFQIRGVLFVLRWIPPGTFLMGSPEGEMHRFEDERPQHEVTMSRGFWMGETPVTQNQWAAIVEASFEWRLIGKVSPILTNDLNARPSKFKGADDLPVENVSWDDCNLALRILNELLHQDLRFQLPTEAQWEYACRAGTQSSFHDGSDCTLPTGFDPALDRLGWFDENSGGKTHPVKQKMPNEWGLYDMHGNVWEWCEDAWRENVYQERKEGVIDPVSNRDTSANRVVRGGSWDYRAQFCRAAFRFRLDPGFGWGIVGFRLSAGQEPAEREGAERPKVPKRRSRG